MITTIYVKNLSVNNLVKKKLENIEQSMRYCEKTLFGKNLFPAASTHTVKGFRKKLFFL